MKTRPIAPNDFELILNLDRQVYPTNKPVTKGTLSNWYKKNPEFGMIFKEEDKITGVGIVIPMNKLGWAKLTKGEISETELNETTLFDKDKDKEIYLHVYHIEKLTDIKNFHKIFLKELKKIIPKKITINGFSGLCVTPQGKNIFENKFKCKEEEYRCTEYVKETDKGKEVVSEGKEKERCKMLILYPEKESIVWKYLKATSNDNPKENILRPSEEFEGPSVKGYDFNQGVDFEKILDSYATMGAQATNLGRAIEIIKEIRKEKAFIYLGYTSNMVSSGLREIFRYLVQHKMVDLIVTTAGGIEEDFIKCFNDFKIGDFNLSGTELRDKGLNRTGNMIVPNNRYTTFEDWVLPILEKYKDEKLTPSKLINLLGKEIDNEESIYYWAYKNKIPVFAPALLDGSLGDMIYFYKTKNPNFKIEITEDMVDMNNSSLGKEKTAMIILGSGIIKHHICNANLYRNGADYAVYINTAQEFDASDSGATPDEAVSWGKISQNAKSVKVHGDATIIFPLIVAKCFSE